MRSSSGVIQCFVCMVAVSALGCKNSGPVDKSDGSVAYPEPTMLSATAVINVADAPIILPSATGKFFAFPLAFQNGGKGLYNDFKVVAAVQNAKPVSLGAIHANMVSSGGPGALAEGVRFLNNDAVMAASMWGRMSIFDLKVMEERHRLDGGGFPDGAFEVSPDGNWVLSGTRDMQLYDAIRDSVTDLPNSRIYWATHESAVFSDDSQFLFYHRDFGSTFIRRKLTTGAEQQLRNVTDVWSAALGGKWATAFSGRYPEVNVLDLDTGQMTAIIKNPGTNDLFGCEPRFSSDGRSLFASCQDNAGLAKNSGRVAFARLAGDAWQVTGQWNSDLAGSINGYPGASFDMRFLYFPLGDVGNVVDLSGPTLFKLPNVGGASFSEPSRWMIGYRAGSLLIDPATGQEVMQLPFDEVDGRPPNTYAQFFGDRLIMSGDCNLIRLPSKESILKSDRCRRLVVSNDGRWAFYLADGGAYVREIDGSRLFKISLNVEFGGFPTRTSSSVWLVGSDLASDAGGRWLYVAAIPE